MDQNEFNQYFRKAMEEYQKSQEKKEAVGFTPTISTPSSETGKKKDAPTAPKMPSAGSASSESHKQNPAPRMHREQRDSAKEFIEVTPKQVHRMYYLLRDLAVNILDPDQSWDSVWEFGSHIIDLLAEINPEEANNILMSALRKVESSPSEDRARSPRLDQAACAAHELFHALRQLDNKRGGVFF